MVASADENVSYKPYLSIDIDNSIPMTAQASLKNAIALKGGMFTLTTIQVLTTDLKLISEALEEKINQAPQFFQYAPVILDISHLKDAATLDFYSLVHTLRSKKLIPVGIKGTDKTNKETAVQAGLAIFPQDKTPAKSKQDERYSALVDAPKDDKTIYTRLVIQPVRSGQQIYAAGCDLIVLASVSHGAEILADGNIHVHGSLRGRVLAGITGNQEAMIYCQSLEAELISIAGQFQLSEDFKEQFWKKSVCIQLQDNRLHIRVGKLNT